MEGGGRWSGWRDQGNPEHPTRLRAPQGRRRYRPPPAVAVGKSDPKPVPWRVRVQSACDKGAAKTTVCVCVTLFILTHCSLLVSLIYGGATKLLRSRGRPASRAPGHRGSDGDLASRPLESRPAGYPPRPAGYHLPRPAGYHPPRPARARASASPGVVGSCAPPQGAARPPEIHRVAAWVRR